MEIYIHVYTVNCPLKSDQLNIAILRISIIQKKFGVHV